MMMLLLMLLLLLLLMLLLPLPVLLLLLLFLLLLLLLPLLLLLLLLNAIKCNGLFTSLALQHYATIQNARQYRLQAFVVLNVPLREVPPHA
jgi:hypothetical protein